jgi:hypothetical protein
MCSLLYSAGGLILLSPWSRLTIINNIPPPTVFTIIADLFDPTRKGRGSIFTANTRLNKAPAAFRNLDYAEAHGYIRGVIKEIIHGQ